MKLKDLANQIEISLESLQNFIYDFDIDLGFCVDEEFNITQAFKDFAIKNSSFLKDYAVDHSKEKTIQDIAKTINVNESDVLNFFKQNGIPEENAKNIKTTLSSYLIHLYIGGEYLFITEVFPEPKTYANKSLIGYSDLYFYLNDTLDPFTNKEQLQNWGISKPVGIVLYGPPGAGKIFWAKKMAQMIGYEFVHVYKDYLAGNLKTSKNSFSHFLSTKMQHPKTMLFIDSLDELLSKTNDLNVLPENLELITTILRHIEKDVQKELVIVGSAEILNAFNDEILAPGRFDLQIPIFPPNFDERCKLILHHLTQNLSEQSPLLAILKQNNALTKDFWAPVAQQMKLFSNTMIIDFTQSLKKRLYALYRKDEKKQITLSDKVLLASFNEAKAKLTSDYLKRCAIFIMEAKQNVGQDFPHRFLELEAELDYYQAKKAPINKIGFKKETNNVETTTINVDEDDALDLMV